MAKRRLLRSPILAIVGILTAIAVASVYVDLTSKSHTSNDISKAADSNGVSEDERQKQEIGVDVGIVTAIMYVDGTPLAVVDGVILREGQSIQQVKVIKINPDSVEFDYNGNRWSQKVNEPSSTQCISAINLRMLPKYPSVEDIVKYVSPAVVAITVYDDMGDELAFGSGFFIGNGTILTNAHIVEGAYSAEVHSLLKTYEDVTIVKRDELWDLALLAVQSVGEPTIFLADGSALRVGQSVLAIGNPEGFERTVSDGIISAIRDEGIQITAPISGGSSGGPLLNIQGSVIGVTYATYSEGQNLNFAVGIETIKQFLRTSDNPEKLEKAGSYIPEKIFLHRVKNIVICIVGLAIVVYTLKKLYRLAIARFGRKNIPVVAAPKEEPYQPVVLSSNKSERQWRSR